MVSDMNINNLEGKNFAGVYFTNSEDYAVVWKGWIVGGKNGSTKCYWPRKGVPAELTVAKTPYDNSWGSYMCQIISVGS